ncbi:hypothetical protein [Okeania sp. KiyG1]|uniref:hypothetical protein n=1 Tax=Okeania sp. KiyG1 TaxID=2720165 RepID=UPI0019241A0A|nr:hypothetical protein [Okeania sp. KiyG1]
MQYLVVLADEKKNVSSSCRFSANIAIPTTNNWFSSCNFIFLIGEEVISVISYQLSVISYQYL